MIYYDRITFLKKLMLIKQMNEKCGVFKIKVLRSKRMFAMVAIIY